MSTPSSRPAFPAAFAALALPLALALGACGRTTKIYSDPVPAARATVTGNLKNPLPSGFFDHSVNLASIDIALDGATATSLALRLQLKPGTNSAGGFNGAGIGNRAILGQGKYSGKKLADFSTITFDAKNVSGTEAVSLSLLVDLDCGGTSSQVFTAAAADLAPGSSQSAGYTRFSADVSDPKWHVSGAAITDPADSTIVLVSSSSSASSPSSLTAFLAKFPNACFFNGVNNDDELPKATPTAAVLLTLGTSATTTAGSVFVNRLSVGTDVYEGLEWGSL